MMDDHTDALLYGLAALGARQERAAEAITFERDAAAFRIRESILFELRLALRAHRPASIIIITDVS